MNDQPPQPQQQPQYAPQQYPPQYAPVPPKKNNCLMYGLIGAVVVLLLCGIVAVALGVIGSKAGPAISALATQVAGTAQPAKAAPSYTEIAAQKGALTAAQLPAYLDGLKGAKIDNWTGTTIDVSSKAFSTDMYQIHVDLTGPTDNPLKNTQAYVDITKEQAQSIAKGKAITFSGNIDHVDCTFICTVEVKNATYTVK